MVAEHGLGLMGIDPYFLQKPTQQPSCFRPNRATSLFVSFPVKENTGGRHQRQIIGLEINDLTDASARVKHKTQQRVITASFQGRTANRTQDGTDFGKVQMLDLADFSPFERNA